MFKPAIVVLAVLSVIFAVLTVYFTLKKKMVLRVVVKTSASLCFLVLGIISLLYAPAENWFVMFLTGLLLGLLGDVFLAVYSVSAENYKDYMNLAGLAFFFLGHIFYIAAFILIADSFNFWLLFIVPVFPAVLFILEKTGSFGAKKALIPVLVYSAVLSSMLVCAINLMLSGGKFNTVIFVAALFFIISDVTHAFYSFGKSKHPAMMYLYMPLYYIAQIIFAASLLI